MTSIREWLILKGLARDMRQWGPFPQMLEERYAGVRVHRLDLPGVGAAKDRRAPATVAETVEDLRTRLAPLRAKHPGPWGLLGASLGGMATMDWCHRYPEDFAAAVVVNASAGDLSLPQSRLRLANLPALLKAGRERDLVERELTVLGVTTTTRGDDRAIAQEWAGYRRDHRLEAGTVVRQLMAGLRFRSPESLEVPVLFLSGGGDRFVAPRCTAKLAGKYGALHEEHPSAGHDLTLDEPDWVIERMDAFLSRLDPVPSEADPGPNEDSVAQETVP